MKQVVDNVEQWDLIIISMLKIHDKVEKTRNTYPVYVDQVGDRGAQPGAGLLLLHHTPRRLPGKMGAKVT